MQPVRWTNPDIAYGCGLFATRLETIMSDGAYLEASDEGGVDGLLWLVDQVGGGSDLRFKRPVGTVLKDSLGEVQALLAEPPPMPPKKIYLLGCRTCGFDPIGPHVDLPLSWYRSPEERGLAVDQHERLLHGGEREGKTRWWVIDLPLSDGEDPNDAVAHWLRAEREQAWRHIDETLRLARKVRELGDEETYAATMSTITGLVARLGAW